MAENSDTKKAQEETPQVSCAHLHVSWRTELAPYDGPDGEYDPESIHVPIKKGQMVTRGWWECDSGCGTRFRPWGKVER